MPSESDAAGQALPPGDPAPAQPAPGSAGNAVLGAAGEAAAFLAGAPIAGAAEAAIGLGDMVTDREAGPDAAIATRHEGRLPDQAGSDPAAAAPVGARSPLLWVLLAVLIAAALIWLFRS